jgi:hypothetical protein
MNEYYHLNTFDSNGVPNGGTVEIIDPKLIERIRLALPEKKQFSQITRV